MQKLNSNRHFFFQVFIVFNDWPLSSNYGCSNSGGDWKRLKADSGLTMVYEPFECQRLCLQYASSGEEWMELVSYGNGCCFVNDHYGCYWKSGSTAVSGGSGLAVNSIVYSE